MEIKIGVQYVQREIVIETEESTNDIKAKVSQALQDKSVLELENTKGAITLIPAEQIGYIELGAETKPRIGFGFSE
ncbi:DUF3107 domain-containing protein [Rothia sp. ND6WE1A]|uniref:DUF3107 domain-containing protein n=1 Tax=Rothia sp. ND6WE1A TaxID=1848190 RepID=UPI0008347A57|nr:DUF3107 domain-containing protein [Rothia sp. ND6WE1A]